MEVNQRNERLPAFLLYEETDSIPLPIQNYNIDIPFNTYKYSLKEGDEILLLIRKEDSSSKSIKNLEIDDIYPIGVKAQITEIIDNNTSLYIETQILRRMAIEEFTISSKHNILIDALGYEFSFSEIDSDFAAKINGLKKEMFRFHKVFPERTLQNLKQTIDPEDLLFVFADIFAKTKNKRLLILNSKDPINIWNTLLKDAIGMLDFKLKEKDAKPSVEKSSEKSIQEAIKSLPIYNQNRKVFDRELLKLENTPPNSNERFLVQDYLNYIKSIPWDKYAKDPLDLEELEKQLDKSHYGLAEVKQNIIEYFCVQQITAASSQVLCLDGPPGTGKTTIAKSIANAARRPLIHIALGGLGDEAELRGFRRTYTGSRPGRLILELINKKCMNPIILFDEVDKMGAHVKGDPIYALLEILDPEQNNHFIDKYIEIPVDLSKCLFICTSNDINNVHSAVRDRMEILTFRDYSEDEKRVIINNYIIPNLNTKLNNENNFDITFDTTLVDSLTSYGIRKVESILRRLYFNAITSIVRKVTTKVVIDTKFAKTIIPTLQLDKKNYNIGFKV